MSVLRYFRKLQMLDNYISRKATGNQEEFAQKTRMSRSMLNEYLKEMKEMGFPISYCKHRNTYYYEQEGCMVKKMFEARIDNPPE
jgi:DNA-binding IclR family transcriptional regulator